MLTLGRTFARKSCLVISKWRRSRRPKHSTLRSLKNQRSFKVASTSCIRSMALHAAACITAPPHALSHIIAPTRTTRATTELTLSPTKPRREDCHGSFLRDMWELILNTLNSLMLAERILSFHMSGFQPFRRFANSIILKVRMSCINCFIKLRIASCSTNQKNVGLSPRNIGTWPIHNNLLSPNTAFRVFNQLMNFPLAHVKRQVTASLCH